MRADELKMFSEEFFECLELYVTHARDMFQSKTPQRHLDEIREVIHTMRATCMMLQITNLTNFFEAFEEFLGKITLTPDGRVPFALNKALDIGYSKFEELDKILKTSKRPTEKIEAIETIETLVEIESFLSYEPTT